MQMILFKMAQQYYLISADSVDEVIDAPSFTKVPLAPEWVEGLINLRGSVVTVIRLAKLIPIMEPAYEKNILIMKKQEETKGVLVEEVIEVLDITEEDIQLDNQETEHAVGVVTIGEKVASVIQIDHMIFLKKWGISVDQVLTQQEIDLLLNAMSSGEIDQEIIEIEDKQAKVKAYDFRRPTKLSKEYVNTLHMIFEDFSKMSSSMLSTQLRTNVSLQLAAIEQVSYDEFIHSIPKFTLLGLFHSQPLSGIQMIEMNPQLCMMLVELLCGGLDVYQNKPIEMDFSEKKSFTDIETAILEEVVAQFVRVYQNVWKDIVALDSVLDGIDTNPQLMQNMSPNEPVVLVTFTIKIFEVKHFINLCIPYVFFEGIIDKLSFRNWFDSNQPVNQDDSRELQKSLNGVGLNLEVLLGHAQMSLSEFLHLEEGDVIKLDKKITEPLETFIDGKPYFRAKPGKQEDRLAIELLDKLEEEQKL